MIRFIRSTLLLGGALMVLADTAAAQEPAVETAASTKVTAHQGTAPSEIVNFASPMILDLALPNVAALDETSRAHLPSVKQFLCDRNVSLQDLAVAKQYKGPKKSRSLRLVVSGAVLVDESYDRRVDIGLRLKSGGEVLGEQKLRNLKTEEGRSTPFHLIFPVEESRLVATYAASPEPTLELTLAVRDDS